MTLEGDKTDKRMPIWSPDGRSIFYALTETGSGKSRLMRRPADGTGASEPLHDVPSSQMIPTSVSPDGQTLLYTYGQPDFNVMALPLTGTRTEKNLTPTPKEEENGEISPNGRWLAYESDETGRREIYVRPFPAVDTGRWQISTGGGRRPAWARNGKELFFDSGEPQMMAVPVSADGKDFTYGRPAPLFSMRPYYAVVRGRTYDVAADGRFILIKEPGNAGSDSPPIVVVEHWIDEVKKRLGQ